VKKLHEYDGEKITRKIFKRKSLNKLLFSFSLPAVIGMFVSASYNIIGRIFVGHFVGTLGIAGVTVTFPIGITFMALSVLIGIGYNVLFSISLGKKDLKTAERILGNAFIMLVVIAVAVSLIFFIFLKPFLLMFGANEEIFPYAYDYARYILPGSVFWAVSLGLNNFIRSAGRPVMAMMTLLIGAIVNIALTPLFLTLGWGIKSAAIATVVAQAVSFAWVMKFFLSAQNGFKLKIQNFALKTALMVKAFAIGSAQFIFQIASMAVNIILNHMLVKHGGSVAVSAIGAIISINMVLVMPIIGISQGMQPLVGYNYGAKKYNLVVKTVRLALMWATVAGVIGFLIIQIFPSHLAMMFNAQDVEFIKTASKGLRLFNLMLPAVGLQIICTGFLLSVNMPKQSILMALTRQVIFLVPLLFVMPAFFGLTGVFLAAPISDLLSALTGLFIINHVIKKYLGGYN
jgi:putative MATE family efflux protein